MADPDQTEARRSQNIYFGDWAPTYLRVWLTVPLPLPQGLDLALCVTNKVKINRVVHSASPPRGGRGALAQYLGKDESLRV